MSQTTTTTTTANTTSTHTPSMDHIHKQQQQMSSMNDVDSLNLFQTNNTSATASTSSSIISHATNNSTIGEMVLTAPSHSITSPSLSLLNALAPPPPSIPPPDCEQQQLQEHEQHDQLLQLNNSNYGLYENYNDLDYHQHYDVDHQQMLHDHHHHGHHHQYYADQYSYQPEEFILDDAIQQQQHNYFYEELDDVEDLDRIDDLDAAALLLVDDIHHHQHDQQHKHHQQWNHETQPPNQHHQQNILSDARTYGLATILYQQQQQIQSNMGLVGVAPGIGLDGVYGNPLVYSLHTIYEESENESSLQTLSSFTSATTNDAISLVPGSATTGPDVQPNVVQSSTQPIHHAQPMLKANEHETIDQQQDKQNGLLNDKLGEHLDDEEEELVIEDDEDVDETDVDSTMLTRSNLERYFTSGLLKPTNPTGGSTPSPTSSSPSSSCCGIHIQPNHSSGTGLVQPPAMMSTSLDDEIGHFDVIGALCHFIEHSVLVQSSQQQHAQLQEQSKQFDRVGCLFKVHIKPMFVDILKCLMLPAAKTSSSSGLISSHSETSLSLDVIERLLRQHTNQYLQKCFITTLLGLISLTHFQHLLFNHRLWQQAIRDLNKRYWSRCSANKLINNTPTNTIKVNRSNEQHAISQPHPPPPQQQQPLKKPSTKKRRPQPPPNVTPTNSNSPSLGPIKVTVNGQLVVSEMIDNQTSNDAISSAPATGPPSITILNQQPEYRTILQINNQQPQLLKTDDDNEIMIDEIDQTQTSNAPSNKSTSKMLKFYRRVSNPLNRSFLAKISPSASSSSTSTNQQSTSHNNNRNQDNELAIDREVTRWTEECHQIQPQRCYSSDYLQQPHSPQPPTQPTSTPAATTTTTTNGSAMKMNDQTSLESSQTNQTEIRNRPSHRKSFRRSFSSATFEHFLELMFMKKKFKQQTQNNNTGNQLNNNKKQSHKRQRSMKTSGHSKSDNVIDDIDIDDDDHDGHDGDPDSKHRSASISNITTILSTTSHKQNMNQDACPIDGAMVSVNSFKQHQNQQQQSSSKSLSEPNLNSKQRKHRLGKSQLKSRTMMAMNVGEVDDDLIYHYKHNQPPNHHHQTTSNQQSKSTPLLMTMSGSSDRSHSIRMHKHNARKHSATNMTSASSGNIRELLSKNNTFQQTRSDVEDELDDYEHDHYDGDYDLHLDHHQHHQQPNRHFVALRNVPEKKIVSNANNIDVGDRRFHKKLLLDDANNSTDQHQPSRLNGVYKPHPQQAKQQPTKSRLQRSLSGSNCMLFTQQPRPKSCHLVNCVLLDANQHEPSSSCLMTASSTSLSASSSSSSQPNVHVRHHRQHVGHHPAQLPPPSSSTINRSASHIISQPKPSNFRSFLSQQNGQQQEMLNSKDVIDGNGTGNAAAGHHQAGSTSQTSIGRICLSTYYESKLNSLTITIFRCHLNVVKKHQTDLYIKLYILADQQHEKAFKKKTKVRKAVKVDTSSGTIYEAEYNEILRFNGKWREFDGGQLTVSLWNNDTFARNTLLGQLVIKLNEEQVIGNTIQTRVWYDLMQYPNTKFPGPNGRMVKWTAQNVQGSLFLAVKFQENEKLNHETVHNGTHNCQTTANEDSLTCSTIMGDIHVLIKEADDLRNIPIGQSCYTNINGYVYCKLMLKPERNSKDDHHKTKSVMMIMDHNGQPPKWNETFIFNNICKQDLIGSSTHKTKQIQNDSKIIKKNAHSLAQHEPFSLEITVIWQDIKNMSRKKSLGSIRLKDSSDVRPEERSLWQQMIERPNLWSYAKIAFNNNNNNNITSDNNPTSN